MSEIKKLFNQSSHYFVGQVVIMAAGFISFPILTRIFSVSDYGMLGLISTTLFIGKAIAKMGSPGSIVRFYPEFKSKNESSVFYSTMFIGYTLCALGVTIIFCLIILLIPNSFLDRKIGSLLLLTSVLIFIGPLNAIVTSFLRAEQKTKLYNIIMIINRYSSLILSIFFLFFFIKGLYGYYIGQIISALIICFVLSCVLIKKRNIRVKYFSSLYFKQSIRFSFPLVWSELGALLLSQSDRYLIQYFLGSVSLGIYTAGYNLTTYVNQIIMYPINYALDPIYLKIFSNKGEEETKIFLSKALNIFLLVIFPVVFGFVAIGKELLDILASNKYADAYIIIPYVMAGNAINACQIFLNAGLFIQKKTHILMNVKIMSCILNIALNIFMIPKYGIKGAAQATLISYIFYTVVIGYFSFKKLSFRIDYQKITLYLTVSLLMYLMVNCIDIDNQLTSLILKIFAGVIFYGILILALDKDIKNFVCGKITGKIRL